MDRQAILVGAAADAAVAILAAVVALPAGVRWPAFAAVAGAGLLGGYLAGRLAGGSWRHRIGHGLLAGFLGGAALAVAVWESFYPGATAGALWPVNYLAATSGIPPDLAARYNDAIPVVVGAAFGALYVVEGAVAGGAAPGGDVEKIAFRE